MELAWKPVADGLEHGGYAAWEAARDAAAAPDAADLMVPVLARLVAPDSGDLDLAGAIAATLAMPQAEFSRHERDLLETERTHAGAGWPHEVRFIAYLRRGMLGALPPFWQVLAVGPGFRPVEAAPPAQADRDLTQVAGTLSPDQPVLAVIDEGIGFLNARFRKAPGKTRFLGVWLQAAERLAQGPVAPWGDIRLGRVLTGVEIDALLASHLTERDLYAQVNRGLYPVTDRAATARRVAHGTHVLDIAGGAGPGDAMAAAPLLAVQLPPASVQETSGRRMESHLVQGLRWILAEVLRQAQGNRVPPVVVNLSMGSLAGPGDAQEFLANWLGYEIDRHRRLAPGAEVRIVGAFGNARRLRLAARAELRVRDPLVLDWRLLPDDRTSSFLEIRVDQAQAAGLTLTLQPPAGSGLPPLQAPWGPGTSGWRLDAAAGGPVAAVSLLPEAGGQALALLCLAPTVSLHGAARAVPGLWRVSLRTALNEPVRVVARVQRDDTPFGHARAGRQSWLDHPEAWRWSEERRDYTQPLLQKDGAGPCPVTTQGSCVSFAGAGRNDILLVGSVRPGRGPGTWQPSAFSAEGASDLHRAGEAAGPTLCAAGESGGLSGGIPAAGLFTGSRVRLAGTSMAAPAVARRLAEYLRDTDPADRSPEAERRALLGGKPWAAEPDRRLGHGVLAPA